MTAAQQKTHRKPVQMELVGGKPARQRVWEQIRLHRERFQIYTIARRAEAEDETVKTYLQCLEKGGYVVKLTAEKFEFADYQLVRDTGIEAPRLTRDGQPVTQGMGQESMWRCLRMLGAMDARQLAMHASSSGFEVKETTARRYVKALKRAGYLQVVQPCNRHRGKLEVIQLIPHMNSGPRPPQIQRVGVVYDPNWNKVMHADEPEEML
ncbi:hypothetical protein [Marinobacterium sp. MBR-109]|jgi:response regulator of citrate/malate metabolism|uniref:hypothetical protein n=1 Tax=Marinobacterium sp. MBR-109 TaxID=3156462 RepID=UPI00339260F5